MFVSHATERNLHGGGGRVPFVSFQLEKVDPQTVVKRQRFGLSFLVPFDENSSMRIVHWRVTP